ncbi:putative nuclease HARBI1 [Rhagoletis pomonella]|uniref:putative nuclease HARBI1 n=1 Tax=Rhagoletis pomonella TaxID=28610 RepID=UPI00177ACF85|nr:putative nuclease HARBI1 [Rhagoletis pomonella]
MEEALLVLCAMQMEQEEVLERKRLLRSLRDSSDPFSMSETVFVQYFRLSKAVCNELIEELMPFDDQKTSLPFGLRFFASLYFFANGSYQKCVGNNFVASMSQPSVSRSLQHISAIIVNRKLNEVNFPKTNEEQLTIKTGFYVSFGVKSTIGAIDCTHIAIIAPSSIDPSKPSSLYMNRKGFYSINVEAVCDHSLKFLAVNARFPGSCHDSGIWTTSAVRLFMMRQSGSWLLGDQGYPLEPWLLTPIPEPSSTQEERYNKLHAKARNVVERAFGVLKSRFRCLSKHRALHYSHERAVNIINACVILHNIALKKCPLTFIETNEAEFDTPSTPANVIRSQYYREGQIIRSRYIQTL